MNHSIAIPGVRRALAAAWACALALAGCVTAPSPPAPTGPVFTPVTWSDLPGWREDRVQSAWPALEASCRALIANPKSRAAWQPTCSQAARITSPDDETARRFFEAHFSPYRIASSDGSTAGLVTGYYEPLLDGSRARSSRYKVPIFAPPDDLLAVELASLYPELAGKRVRGRLEGRKVVPYWTRAEIESGRAPLEGKALAYVADPIDAFFLQIQGSGRVRLHDGTLMRIGYADQNGQPYTAVGRVLVDQGELAPETVSMQSIRAWGERNPGRLAALLDANASYVFFREVPPPAPGTLEARIDGPVGSLGVPLLARRAIAVDPKAIPLGAPVYLATTRPQSRVPLQRLTFAQDTGGAIRGTIRADFFWGTGEAAAHEAGRMRETGSLWLLWPKGEPVPDGSR